MNMTKLVTFPGLGLEFTLNPIAFTVFGWSIHWYGIIIACGFLLAVLYGYRKAPRFGVDQDKLIDMLFFAVPLSIIGARAYYVIFYSSLYQNADGSFSWSKAVAIWDGGLAIYGAVIAAVLTVAVYCRVRKQSFWCYVDVGCYGLLIGQLVGRWGNFVNVECYGGLTTLPWRMCSETIANELWYKGVIDSSDVYQSILDGTVGVHPTFLYESLWNLLGFVILVLIARKGRKFDGQMFLSYVVWYGLGRAAIEGLRTDSLYFFGTGIRTSQMLGLFSALVALGVMAVRRKTAGAATPPIAPTGAKTEEKSEPETEETGSDETDT
jgi:phosphatidylglycerol:prolipoprotein diacylglycerol transferase